MAGSTVFGFPLPENNVVLNAIAQSIRDAVNALESYLVGRFTGTSDRNTKFPSPTAGQMGYLQSATRIEYYDGAAWGPIADLAAVTSGTGTPYRGTRPAQQARFIDADTKVVTTGGAGTFTLTFSNPFPNVVESVVVTIADGGDGNAALPRPAAVALNQTPSDLTKITGRIYYTNNTDVGAGATIRLNYVAIGQ